VHRTADLLIADSGLDERHFNVVVATQFSDATADDRIAATLRDLRARPRPFTWCAGPGSTPADLPDRLAAVGLTPGAPETAMRRDLAALPPVAND
jgi:hypothetical protein